MARVAYLEDELLGFIDDLSDIAFRAVTKRYDLRRVVDEAAQDRLFPDDLDIMADIGRGRDRINAARSGN